MELVTCEHDCLLLEEFRRHTLLWPLETDIELLPTARLVCELKKSGFGDAEAHTIRTKQSACCFASYLLIVRDMASGKKERTVIIDQSHFIIAHEPTSCQPRSPGSLMSAPTSS